VTGLSNAALGAIAEYLDYQQAHKREWPPEWYDWQLEAFRSRLPQVMTLAGNQTGKTWSSTYNDALDLTGDYPEDWEGFQFDHAINALVIGVDNVQLEVLQTALLGKVDGKQFQGGWIHKDEIKQDETSWSTNSKNIASKVVVQGKFGKSTIHLRTYTQAKTGQDTLSFAGFVFDLIHCDEQPPDSLIGQLAVRLINGNRGKGGRLRLTMTPELGRTALVTKFMDDIDHGTQHLIGPVHWDQCAHMTPSAQAAALALIPEHEHEMRRSGQPFMGSGMVYPVAESRLIVPNQDIMPHWKVLKGVDLGHTHPQTTVWMALDMDQDVLYLIRTESSRGGNASTHMTTINSMWPQVPTVFPPDLEGTEKGSGETTRDWYKKAGLTRSIAFQNPDGSNYVEPGIYALNERMQTDRFKVFEQGNDAFFREKRLYHRVVTPQGVAKLVKKHDDVMDGVRYTSQMIAKRGVMMGQHLHKPRVLTSAGARRGLVQGVAHARKH
jgi:hypothetical protein